MKWSDLINVSVLLSLSGSLFAKNIPDYSPSGKLTQTFPVMPDRFRWLIISGEASPALSMPIWKKAPSFLSVSG